MNPTFKQIIPNCIIVPSSSGSLSNCITMQTPSIGTMVAVIVISWIFFLAVAYAIYYFSSITNPSFEINYWIILGILIVSGLVTNLITLNFA